MDILSLPEEMLASVYKHVNNRTMMKCRRLSSKINAIALKYRLNEVILQKLQFKVEEEQIEATFNDYVGNENKQIATFTEETRNETIFSVVRNIYTKVRYIERFEILKNTKDNISLPTGLINMMIENSKGRRISKITFFGLIIDIDAHVMRRFLTTFKFKSFALLICETPNLELYCSLFNGLIFDELTLFVDLQVNMDDLKTICTTKIPKDLHVVCGDVTLREAVEFLKDVLSRNQEGFRMFLGGVDFEGRTREESKSLLNSLGAVTQLDIGEEFLKITRIEDGVDITLHNKSQYGA